MTGPVDLQAKLLEDVATLRDDLLQVRALPNEEGERLLWAVRTWVAKHADARVLLVLGDRAVMEAEEPSRSEGLGSRHERLESLVHALSPALDIETPVEVLQVRRNAEARALLLSEFGALRSAQVADLLGSEAKNRSALAHRWRKERRLLAVDYRGAVWFPGFQFHDGGVVPVMSEVLDVLAGAGLSDWETALWFTAPNGWLDDRRPVDSLVDEPGGVVDAARFEVADFGG